jgi:hypothetical protein
VSVGTNVAQRISKSEKHFFLYPGTGVCSTFSPQTVESLCSPQFSGGMHCARDVEFSAAVAQRSSRRVECMLLGWLLRWKQERESEASAGRQARDLSGMLSLCVACTAASGSTGVRIHRPIPQCPFLLTFTEYSPFIQFTPGTSAKEPLNRKGTDRTAAKVWSSSKKKGRTQQVSGNTHISDGQGGERCLPVCSALFPLLLAVLRIVSVANRPRRDLR